jgi:glycosyltransferase involved in cell wall biosynthesis
LEKIALYIISDGIGGAERVVWQLLNGYIEKKRFFLIVNNEIASYYSKLLPVDQYFNIGNVYSKNCSQNKVIRFLYRLIKFRLIKIKLKTKEVNEYLQINAIHCIHAHLDYALFSALLIKKKNDRLKIIYTVHGVLGLIEEKSAPPDISHKKLKYALVDTLVFVSNYVNEVYLSNKIPVNHSQVIYNGLDIQPSISSEIKSISTDKFKILYVGGVKFIKGYDLLIETVQILSYSELRNKFKVIVLGEIPKDSAFFERIKNFGLEEYFDIIGFVSPPKHLEYFNKADLLFIPSRSETICLAAIEGIQYNLPIVATNVGGLAEVLRDGFNGLLAKPDPEEFGLRITDIFNNYVEFAAKAKEVNRELIKKFDAINMCNMYLKLYENIIML